MPTLRLLIRLLGLLRGYYLAMTLAVICGLAYTLLSLLPPLIVRQVIRQLTEPSGVSPESAGEQLAVLALLLAGIAVLRGLTRYGEAIISHVVAYRMLHELMVKVYAHLQGLPQKFFTDRRSGELASRAVTDSTAIESFVAHALGQATQAVLVPLAMIAVLLYLNWQLALLTLLPLPIAAWLMLAFLPPAQERWRRVRVQLGELGAAVQESIAGIAVIRAFGRERERLALVSDQSRRFRDEIIGANYWTLVPTSGLEVLAGLGAALVIWQGGLRGVHGDLSAADLFVFVFYLAHIYQPLLQLTALNEGTQTALASAERVFALLDAQPDIVDAPHARAPAQIKWSVEFDQVTFGYDPATPVLRDVSFRVDEGETVALVGMTGAGKTTTVNLLPRFYDVQGGAVRIGGHDVRDLPLEFMRASVAMVLQDVFLFHGTVRDNLLLGRPDATDDEVIAAAKAAHAHEFIMQLPEGYATLIGERGVRLSGGQKQRLSIARALLKDAPILVLDEATSSVDAETEGEIQEALARLTVNRTTIVIAHRLPTIRTADRIVVLDAGRVAEIGTHEELIARGGLYAAMERAHSASRRWTIPGRGEPIVADRR